MSLDEISALSPFPLRFSRRMHVLLVVFLLLVICLTLVSAAYFYQSAEQFFYFWDYRGFHGVAADFAKTVVTNWREGLQLLYRSMFLEYNLIFAIPLIPFLALGDFERTPYILALTGLFLVPYCVIVGLICRRAFSEIPKFSFWAGIILISFVPTVWLAVMRGYPDVLAAAIMLLGLLIAMHDAKLKSWRSVFAIAFMLALATTVRRHLAYAAVSLLITIATVYVSKFVSSFRIAKTLNPFAVVNLGETVRYLCLPILFVVLLTAMNYPLVRSIFTVDYGSLYSSYRLTATTLIAYIYNILLGTTLSWLVVAGALAAILRFRHLDHGARLGNLFFVIWIVVWILLAGQAGSHHLVVALPVIGLFAMFHIRALLAGSLHKWIGNSVFVIMCIAIATNAFVTYTPVSSLSKGLRQLGNIWTANSAPLYRSDFDTVISLTESLSTGPQPTLVAASNEVLNFGVLHDVMNRFFKDRIGELALIVNPQIDSRDPLPVEDLLRARQVVITRPFQYHLPDPKEQEVVSILLELFEHSATVSKSFKKQENAFLLGTGAKSRTEIYRRVKDFSFAEAEEIYKFVRSRVKGTQVFYKDYWYWNPARPVPGITWTGDGARGFHFSPNALAESEQVELTSLSKYQDFALLSGSARVEGRTCEGATVQIGTIDGINVQQTLDLPNGREIDLATTIRSSDGFHVKLVFALKREGQECYLSVWKLRLTQK